MNSMFLDVLFVLYMMAYLHTLSNSPSIRIVVILFYDDVDISNEGKCFNATSVISTLMQHIDKCFLPIV